jgi:hypothetical protein
MYILHVISFSIYCDVLLEIIAIISLKILQCMINTKEHRSKRIVADDNWGMYASVKQFTTEARYEQLSALGDLSGEHDDIRAKGLKCRLQRFRRTNRTAGSKPYRNRC